MANELILIVEDNEKNRKLARDILQVKGYRTIEAETAETGLEMAPKENPDLVLMDIQLPGMNGIQALKKLRANEATRAIPVLAFTASVMPQDRREEMGRKGRHYFEANFSRDMLFRSLETWMAETVKEKER